jgi:SMC interacting uncharacterized protein involved in chromosome segregation
LTEEVKKENGQGNIAGTGSETGQKMTEYERIIAEKESEITALKKSADELKEQLSSANKSLAEAVAGYKAKVIQMNPGVTEKMIDGKTIAAVENAVADAIEVVAAIKKSVEKEIRNKRVPAGAPGRGAADVSAMSPREKIQHAIGGKK